LLARHRRDADGDGGEWRVRVTSHATQAFPLPLPVAPLLGEVASERAILH
jgi:hypothetical protein